MVLRDVQLEEMRCWKVDFAFGAAVTVDLSIVSLVLQVRGEGHGSVRWEEAPHACRMVVGAV